MKERKINYGLIIFIIVLIILFIPIISDYIKKQNIEVVSSSDVEEKINAKESFIVYIGEADKSVKKELRTLRDATKNDYSYEYNIYNVASNDAIKRLIGKNVEAAMYIEGDLQELYTKYDFESLEEDVNEFLIANFNDDNISFEIADDFKEYKKIIKSKDIVMSVFGRDTCYYCNKFKPVYNAVVEKYDLDDVYYFDSDSYNANEYKKIINLDLTIPAKCNSNGTEFKLSDGFGTPLTIFTKSGKVIDCISGYVDRTSLVNTLKNIKMISE